MIDFDTLNTIHLSNVPSAIKPSWYISLEYFIWVSRLGNWVEIAGTQYDAITPLKIPAILLRESLQE